MSDRWYGPLMDSRKVSNFARSAGRGVSVGIVILIAAFVARLASTYRWLQILIGLWTIPFVGLAVLGGGELGEAVAKRFRHAKLRRAAAAREALSIDDDAAENSKVPTI
jgi:hypothetical protein